MQCGRSMESRAWMEDVTNELVLEHVELTGALLKYLGHESFSAFLENITLGPIPGLRRKVKKCKYSRLSLYRTQLIRSLADIEQISESRRATVIKYSN